MVSDEKLFRMMIRANAFMRRSPHLAGGEQSGTFSQPQKGFSAILDILAENPGITQARTAELSRMRQQSVSEALSSLEHRGYLVRTPSEKDKRVFLLSLTEEGKTAQKESFRQRQELAKSFFSVLTEEEKENLYHILQKLEEPNL